jgi:hypothetical protein
MSEFGHARYFGLGLSFLFILMLVLNAYAFAS